jgi:hypothetical protein
MTTLHKNSGICDPCFRSSSQTARSYNQITCGTKTDASLHTAEGDAVVLMARTFRACSPARRFRRAPEHHLIGCSVATRSARPVRGPMRPVYVHVRTRMFLGHDARRRCGAGGCVRNHRGVQRQGRRRLVGVQSAYGAARGNRERERDLRRFRERRHEPSPDAARESGDAIALLAVMARSRAWSPVLARLLPPRHAGPGRTRAWTVAVYVATASI